VDDEAKTLLKERTLTNLYNEQPTWLLDVNRQLEEAVFSAYGWEPTLTDKELLALNLMHAKP
jgi:hypothetical protein